MIEVVVLWIMDDAGKLLLAQRSFTKQQDPGVWGPSVTGKVEPGESFAEALAREVQEELSLDPSTYVPELLFEQTFPHPDGNGRHFVIYCTRLPDALLDHIKYDESEVATVQWFTMDDLLRWMRDAPAELVPSAGAVWPRTIDELRARGGHHTPN